MTKKNLHLTDYVDENLKLIRDEDGTDTALELSKDKLKINGDLAATGYTDNIKLRSEAIIKTDGNVTLDSAGDITLDADDGAIYLKDGGTTFGFFSTGGSVTTLKLLEDGGAGTDSLAISAAEHGNTIITTNDIAGTDANLTLNIDGDITLNSATGVFIAEKSGTEFSAANSAYAGMILGYTALAIDAGDASYTTTTSMAVPHSSLQVTFRAPPSGKVEISVSVFVDTVAGRNLVFGLSDNSTYSPIDFPNADDVTNEHYVYKGDETDEEDVTHQWVVEGLTPGTSYTWYFGAKALITAGAYVLKWGGNVTGEYAPFIMKATALPATIYTG
jgi:hypothetical protein